MAKLTAIAKHIITWWPKFVTNASGTTRWLNLQTHTTQDTNSIAWVRCTPGDVSLMMNDKFDDFGDFGDDFGDNCGDRDDVSLQTKPLRCLPYNPDSSGIG